MLIDSIIRYLKLDYRIEVETNKLNELRNRHYNQSYHTRTEVSEAGELKVKSFRFEDKVCNFIESTKSIEKRIKEEKQKKRYFDDYLHTLTPEAREYLYNRYLNGLDVTVNEKIENDTVQEIQEIEEAIAFRNGKKPSLLSQVENGAELDFNELLEVLEV